ncbi:MAG: redox-regulated ATPase YchF [Patescibacteria group bacterium]|nr:redox-regulated ATPase YchF [Patescibacteria group bacterium]MDD4695503.1 redox-regulated ATPase YchF [Patescibacteria group bacterium]
MSFSIGIVGLPNVGKSTLFKALTKKQVDASNYPFCTIEPNVGVVAVPDERLDKLSELNNSQKTIYTTIEFVDIAGLVKGASKGEGLGNKFLANIREVDAILQVVRRFKDENVIHVHGEVNPVSDREVINMELIFADLEILNKVLDKTNSQIKGPHDKSLDKYKELLEKIKTQLESNKLIFELGLSDEEKFSIKSLNFLTLKPMLYVYNVDEDEVNDIVNDGIIICAKIESELAELSDDDAKEYMESLGMQETGLNKLIKEAYKTLNLITYLTSGPEESRAWTIETGTKAPQAAGKIHTDFEDGFIRAEIINWQDLLDAGGEVKAKEKGLVRLEGKDYIFKDGDVTVFRFAN